MLTAAQISGATGDALTRLGLQVADASFEDQKSANAAYKAAIDAESARHAATLAALGKVSTALEAANAQSAAAAGLALTKKQQAFFDLYALHLKARKDPAVITSATADTVVKDVANDAMMMTLEVWPMFKQSMAAMEVPPGGVDWT